MADRVLHGPDLRYEVVPINAIGCDISGVFYVCGNHWGTRSTREVRRPSVLHQCKPNAHRVGRSQTPGHKHRPRVIVCGAHTATSKVFHYQATPARQGFHVTHVYIQGIYPNDCAKKVMISK